MSRHDTADALFARLRARPADAPAVVGASGALDGSALADAADALAELLRSQHVRVLATLLDNGIAWIVADLASLRAGIVHVPLPLFFTAAQRGHVLDATGADAILAADLPVGFECASVQPCRGATLGRRHVAPVRMPQGTAKVTFTSGTTGEPKGVCIAAEATIDVARGLAAALAPQRIERHLVALPLPVLLENLAGVIAPLWQGATVVVPPLAEAGLSGSSTFDPARLDACCDRHTAHSVIVLPQMLRAWATWRHARGARTCASLRFVAAGGAPVGEALLAMARRAGLPAYEGYGLSEGASVQTLNLPGAERPGSVGRALPHARVRVADDGEIMIAGTTMLGYLGDAAATSAWWPTGDLGWIDGDGYVHVRGRRKHVLVTSFGRNVSPEWVETTLAAQDAIALAVVFGDGQPALSAVVWPAAADTEDAALDASVRAANATLPDYARVARWVRARAAYGLEAGTATANGRPRRAAIHQLHADALPAYDEGDTMPFHEQLQTATAAERAALVAAPIIQGTMRGEVSLASYLAFLEQAWHHVRHTVPLLEACRAHLPPRLAWMRPALDEYVDEETDHDAWILGDIAACGGDPKAVCGRRPAPATELMVAYAWDTVTRGNPVGFLGMVHVLEGTSAALALTAADRIQRELGLPDEAFTYLRSHGMLDQEHTKHLAMLLDRLDDAADRDAVTHAARMFYRLYGDIFRGLPLPVAAKAAA